METEPEEVAPTRSPKSNRWFSPLVGLIRAGAVGVIVAAIPIFVVFANTQIKDMIDRHVGGCLFVLDKKMADNGSIEISGWLSGTPPARIPLMFVGRDATLNTIVLEEPFRRDSISEPSDIAVHPMTGMSCPGALCEGDEAQRHQVLVVLTDLRSEFMYRFGVRMKPYATDTPLTTRNLKLYALYEQGLSGGVCRVQTKRWFNFLVWAEPINKLMSLILILAVCASLFSWASWYKEKHAIT